MAFYLRDYHFALGIDNPIASAGRQMKIPFTGKAIRIGQSDTLLEREIRELQKDAREAEAIIDELLDENKRLADRIRDLLGQLGECNEMLIQADVHRGRPRGQGSRGEKRG